MIDNILLPIMPGQVCYHLDHKLLFMGRVGDRMHFQTEAGGVFLIDDETIDAEAMPRLVWFLQEYIASRLMIPSSSANEDGRHARLLRLDIAAAVVRDPKSIWRMKWAQMLRDAKLGQSNHRVKIWLGEAPCPAVPEMQLTCKSKTERQPLEQRLAAIFLTKPSARSVMEWEKKLKINNIGDFVSKAGRPLGTSQLCEISDRLVTRATELFYDNENELFPSIEDAAAVVVRWWEALKAECIDDIGEEAPVYETIRNRIRKNETGDNYEKRYGRAARIAKFAPKGEGLEIARPFEVVYMDGTSFEHYTRYTAEWYELAGKLKGVAAMCAYSLYKWPYSVFYGPFRPEVSLQALMNVLVPKVATAEDIEVDPTSLIYGTPSRVDYDNDRALLPPWVVPSLSTGMEIQLLGTYHHDGKSPLEASFKHDKQRLRSIKGLVLPPRRKHDPRYKPEKAANLIKAQYEFRVEQARRDWNNTPKASLGERSPNDIMLEFLRENGVQRYANPT